jgi:hypothetical protein
MILNNAIKMKSRIKIMITMKTAGNLFPDLNLTLNLDPN